MSEEVNTGLDHNTALQNLIEVGDEQDVAMILGHKDKLRCGGIIRTGIKVLKKEATPAERKLFAELEAQGLPYDEIDRKLGGEPKTAKSKLFPKNANHFVIRDCDFTRAGDAQMIRSKFADPDGFVRSFPIWLATGDLDKVLWHSFKAFSGSGNIVATSFYDDDKKLLCRYLPKDFKGAAKKEDWLVGDFDPNNPVSPAGHKMQFGGLIRFNVPGLRGFDEIFIPTKSFYGIGYSVALLRRVRARLGRFDGTLNGQPFLCISKVPEDMTDPKGNRVTQYIPVIELGIDPLELERYAEPGAVAARASHAMQLLTGAPAPRAAAAHPPQPPVDTQVADDLPAGMGETAAAADPLEDPTAARQKKGHEALLKLAASIGLLASDLDNLAASIFSGALVETLEIQQLENFYRQVHASFKTNGEGFVADVKAMRKG